MFKVNNKDTRTTPTPEQHHLRRSGVFIVNAEHISHLVLLFLLLPLNSKYWLGYMFLHKFFKSLEFRG